MVGKVKPVTFVILLLAVKFSCGKDDAFVCSKTNKDNFLKGSTGNPGPPGATGPAGPKGDPGPAGKDLNKDGTALRVLFLNLTLIHL